MVLNWPLEILSWALLLAGLVSAIYLIVKRPRRHIAQHIMLLAMSGVLLIDATQHSGWRRWTNVGVAVFAVGCVVFQVVWDRRRKVS